MPRLDPPGHLNDLDDAQKDDWSARVSRWLDRAQVGAPAENDGPRGQFFNPLHHAPDADQQVAVISWNAFPRQVRSSSLSDRQRWRTADADRNVQDEYCEWSVERDATGNIVRVMFTCEGPEYWTALAELAPDTVVALYREHISSAITKADLFVGGVYNPLNRFNNGTANGAMHLIQGANTLTAEIQLAAAATIRRIKDGHELTGAQELIECSYYGNSGRNSDPHIGEQVNALARQGADITLNNPVGLYLHGFNPVGWTTPDGTDPRDFWKVTRGEGGYAVRAIFEVPAANGYTVSDIAVAGKKIAFGAQIADFITIKLEGLATRIGQSQVQPFDGCRVEAGALGVAPPDALGASLPSRQYPSGAEDTTEADNATLAEVLPAALRSRDVELVEEAPPALIPYPRLPAAKFVQRKVTGRILAYASPDSTFAVTRKLIDAATKSIVVGIYDFNASYVKDALKRAMQRGVKLSLMLDTNAADDEGLFGELRALGATCVQAPSSSAGHASPYFGNAHEKIIVIDSEIVMIQSGNWSENSIPFNEQDGGAGAQFASGNRDMGLAIESKLLSTLFADLVLRDMRLSQGLPPDAAPPEAPAAGSSLATDIFFEAAPDAIPQRLFPSISFVPETSVPITPVVTPENFEPVLKELLASAKHSLRIEQQYIRGHQPTVKAMLQAIADARSANADLDIKIIVSPKYLYGDDKTTFLKAMRDFEFDFDENFRFLSLKHFVHCHNKLIIVDDTVTLLGSQNWSTTGIVSNREASLLVESSKIARYFAGIFDADWDMSAFTATPSDLLAALADASTFAEGGVVTSSVRDYADV